MLNIQGKQVTIAKTLELNARQLLRLKHLNKSHKLDYVLSILGKQSYLDVKTMTEKLDAQIDPLANKRPGNVLEHLRQILNSNSGVNHKPVCRTKTSQWIGVEIECYINGAGDEHEDDCEHCSEGSNTCYNCGGNCQITVEDSNGFEYEVDCRSCDGEGNEECSECGGAYESQSGGSNEVKTDIRNALKKAKVTNCSVRSDGSLSNNGLELCLLFDASKGFDKLEKVCEILNDFDASVNYECGLHVHLDHFQHSKETVKKIGKHFEKFLPILTQFLPESRQDNNYCRLQSSDSERYSAINLCAFQKHKSIEVRLHSGSTNFDKIKNWIELLLIIRARFNPDKPLGKVKTFQYLIDTVKLPNHLIDYYDKRLQKFNPSEALDPENCSTCDDEACGNDCSTQDDVLTDEDIAMNM